MNLKNRLRHLALKSGELRMYGKTTSLAKITKELGGILLTANIEEAKRIGRAHNVPTKSIDVNLESVSGPFIMDHYALESLLLRTANKIESLENTIEELEKQNEELKRQTKDLWSDTGR